MVIKMSKVNWEEWLPKCPKCGSTNVEPSNKYKNIFNKFKPTTTLYKCKECGHEFWY